MTPEPMDVIGIGVDLVHVPRMMTVDRRWGNRFRERVFTAREISYSTGHDNPYVHFAGQFAVKEAVMKAIGRGWKSGIRWCDIEVRHDRHGGPVVHLSGKAEQIFFEHGGKKIFCSISHDHEYAVAQVVMTGVCP